MTIDGGTHMLGNFEVPNTIKIFLASPSDVEQERDALSALVREINDVLAFLVPDCALRLELVRYETHTYPDMGQAQEVINRQIPINYGPTPRWTRERRA